MKRYEGYKLNFSNNGNDELTLSAILSIADVMNKKESNGFVYTLYDISCLLPYMPEGSTIQNIEYDGFSVYVGYLTAKNEGVMLRYVDGVLVEKAISNWDTGENYVIIKDSDVRKYTIENSLYSLSDEHNDMINYYLRAGDYDSINQISGVRVDYSDVGMPIIRIDFDEMDGHLYTSSEKIYIPNVQTDFPVYSKVCRGSSSQHCSSLGRNISLAAYDSRYNYREDSISLVPFAIGVALTLITTSWCPGTTVAIDAVRDILGYIGATYSIIGGVEQLTESIKLANGGVIKYVGTRDGVVYDTTNYSSYVRVVSLSANAEFHLVSNPNYGTLWGEFNGQPNVFGIASSGVMNSAAIMYSQDIEEWGYCHSYYPYTQYNYN